MYVWTVLHRTDLIQDACQAEHPGASVRQSNSKLWHSRRTTAVISTSLSLHSACVWHAPRLRHCNLIDLCKHFATSCSFCGSWPHMSDRQISANSRTWTILDMLLQGHLKDVVSFPGKSRKCANSMSEITFRGKYRVQKVFKATLDICFGGNYNYLLIPLARQCDTC